MTNRESALPRDDYFKLCSTLYNSKGSSLRCKTLGVVSYGQKSFPVMVPDDVTTTAAPATTTFKSDIDRFDFELQHREEDLAAVACQEEKGIFLFSTAPFWERAIANIRIRLN